MEEPQPIFTDVLYSLGGIFAYSIQRRKVNFAESHCVVDVKVDLFFLGLFRREPQWLLAGAVASIARTSFIL